MDILEFLLILEARFGDLGDPTDITGNACCPLGLVQGDPEDLNPQPEDAAEKTGLPLKYCMGVAEGWDNTAGFHVLGWPDAQDRGNYLLGLRDGSRARHRWLREHPKVSPVEKSTP